MKQLLELFHITTYETEAIRLADHSSDLIIEILCMKKLARLQVDGRLPNIACTQKEGDEDQ